MGTLREHIHSQHRRTNTPIILRQMQETPALLDNKHPGVNPIDHVQVYDTDTAVA